VWLKHDVASTCNSDRDTKQFMQLSTPSLVDWTERTGCVGTVTAQSYSHLLLPVGQADGHSLLHDEAWYLTDTAATVCHMLGIIQLPQICDISGLNYTVKLTDGIFSKFC
jgi:hypothetical protein